jgi:hypothetical protein
LLAVVEIFPQANSRGEEAIDGGELDFQFDRSNPLGLIAEGGANAKAVGITQYGLTTKVEQNLILDEAKTSGTNIVFPDTTPEVIWFAQFGIRGSMKNNFSRSYQIEWYSPDGKLYLRNKFKSGFWNETFAKTSLKLPKPLPDLLIGRWRVRVWKKKTLLDDRYFEIVRS